MNRQEQAVLIRTLLIGEVLVGISRIAYFRIFFSFLIFASFFAVIGIFMVVFAAIRLKNVTQEFKEAFYLALFNLVIALVTSILYSTYIGTENLAVFSAASTFSAIEMFIRILVVYKTLKGCRILVNQVDKDDKFGFWTTLIYTVLAVAGIGIIIAAAYIPDLYTLQILYSVLVGVDITAAIVYVIALIRTHNTLLS